MDKQLLRHLHDVKYRELATLVNKKVTIASLDSIAMDVETAVRTYLPTCGRLELDSSNLRPVLAKYKMLDLCFTTSIPVLIQGDKVDRKILGDLGFLAPIPPDEVRAVDNSDEEDPTCLTELIQEAQKGLESLKIILDVWPIRDACAEYVEAITKTENADEPFSTAWDKLCVKVNDLFPGTFVIRDACITNSDFVWLHKHFYM